MPIQPSNANLVIKHKDTSASPNHKSKTAKQTLSKITNY